MDIQALLPLKPKDRGGAVSSRGLLFQKHWALSLMLSEFQKGNDFIILFDYLDDVVLMRKIGDKETISFYQIKTKETDIWNESKICNGNCKILSNLFANYISYKPYIEDLKVISNAAFQRDGQILNVFNFSDFSNKYKTKIKQSLFEEFQKGETEVSSFLIVGKFEKTSLSFEDMETHTIGIVNKFIENITNCHISAIPLKTVLLSEIERRNSCATKEFPEYNSLCRQKGIDRKFLQQEIIDKLNTSHIQNHLEIVVKEIKDHHDINSQQQIESIRGYNKAYNDLRSTNVETIRLFHKLSSFFNQEYSRAKSSLYEIVQSTVRKFLSLQEYAHLEKQYGLRYLEGIVWNVVVSSEEGGSHYEED